MCKEERFTKGNHLIYKEYLVKLMKYLEDWKMAQLRRSRIDGSSSLKSFLAHETYQNAQMAVWGWYHFSVNALKYLSEKIPEIKYIQMQCSTTTKLKSGFSKIGYDDNDYTNKYAGGITNYTNQMMAAGTAQTGSSYDTNDLMVPNDDSESGSRAFFGFQRKIDKKVED